MSNISINFDHRIGFVHEKTVNQLIAEAATLDPLSRRVNVTLIPGGIDQTGIVARYQIEGVGSILHSHFSVDGKILASGPAVARGDYSRSYSRHNL